MQYQTIDRNRLTIRRELPIFEELEEQAPSPEQKETSLQEKNINSENVHKLLEGDEPPHKTYVTRSNCEDSDLDSITDDIPLSPSVDVRKSAKSCGSVPLAVDSSDEEARDDDDVDTVLDTTEGRRSVDSTGQRAYTNACRRFRSVPSASFHRQLAYATSIDMGHYGAGPKGVKAIAIPMLINTKVTSLNLKANDLSRGGMDYIAGMMADNDYITDLNLSENNLRGAGAKLIAYMMSVNSRITKLDISGNNFSDADACIICKSLEHHPSLVSLNFSNNHFGEASGQPLRKLLVENEVIQDLDLSWNHLQSGAAAEIAEGLKDNITLRTLTVSWNGFGNDGAIKLARVINVSALHILDLSCNRVYSAGYLALINALETEDDLKTLRLCRNPIKEEDALESIKKLMQYGEMSLETLDMGEIMFGRKFVDALEEVKLCHPNLKIKYGYTDSYGKRKLKQYNVVEEALQAMNTYCEENNINIVDLFQKFDEDGSMSVTHDEFKQGLKDSKIPLTPLQVEELINSLDQDGDGEIDFSELVLGAESITAGDTRKDTS